MNASPPGGPSRPHPRFLDGWRDENGEQTSPFDFLSLIQDQESKSLLFVVQFLFCPNFFEYRNGVFLSDTSSDLPQHRKHEADKQFSRFPDHVAKVEYAANRKYLPVTFSGLDFEEDESDAAVLVESIAECWRGLLQRRFPEREMTVETIHGDDPDWFPQITFYSTPKNTDETVAPPVPPAPGAIAFHDLPPGRFAAVGEHPVSLHLDLPPSLRQSFAGLALPGRAQEVDLRAGQGYEEIAHALAPGAETLHQALTAPQAPAVLLSKFEQLWVKNRPAAEQLVGELPAALAAARASGATAHLALADLASDTASAVRRLLAQSASEAGTPVPAYCYPPSA